MEAFRRGKIRDSEDVPYCHTFLMIS
jgi:hypothetical protein